MSSQFHHPELNSETIEQIIENILVEQDRKFDDPNERVDQGLFAIWFDDGEKHHYFVGNKHDPLGALNAYLEGMQGLGLSVLHVRQIKPCATIYAVLYVPEGKSLHDKCEWLIVSAFNQDDAEQWVKRNVLDFGYIVWVTTDAWVVENIMRGTRKSVLVLGEQSP